MSSCRNFGPEFFIFFVVLVMILLVHMIGVVHLEEASTDQLIQHLMSNPNRKFSHPLENSDWEFIPTQYGNMTEMLRDKCRKDYAQWLMVTRKKPSNSALQQRNVYYKQLLFINT